MEGFEGILPDRSIPAPKVKLDNETYDVYDGDTLISRENNTSLRIKGLNSPEKINILETENAAILQRDIRLKDGDPYQAALAKGIKEDGFDIVKAAGKDVYGRDLVHLKSKSGRDLANTLIREGKFDPSKYELDSASQAEAVSSYNMDLLFGLVESPKVTPAMPALGALSEYEEAFLPANLKDNMPNTGPSTTEQLGDSMYMWWRQNVGAFEGLKGVFADATGNQIAENEAISNLVGINKETAENINPNTIFSLKDVNDSSDFAHWFGNNLAMYAPDFAILAGGAKTGAAAGSLFGPGGTVIGGTVGAVTALGYTFLKITGDAAAESAEVNKDISAGNAITIGTVATILEKVGLDKVLKPTQFLTKEGLNKASKEYAEHVFTTTGKTITTAQAKNNLNNFVLNGAKDIHGKIGVELTDLMTKRRLAGEAIKAVGAKALVEGTTEGLQELAQFAGVRYEDLPAALNTDKKREDFLWRMIDATAAGGAIGGTFGLGSTLLEINKVQNLKTGLMDYDPEKSNLTQRLAVEGNKEFDYQSVETAVKEYNYETEVDNSLEERSDRARGTNTGKTYMGRALNKIMALNYIPGLGAAKNMIRPYLIKKDGSVSKEATLLANIEGAYQTMSGNTVFNEEQQRIGVIQSIFPWLSSSKRNEKSTNDLIARIEKIDFNPNKLETEFVNEKELEAATKLLIDLDTLANHLYETDVALAFGGVEISPDNLIREVLFGRNIPDTTKVKNKAQTFIEKLSTTKSEGNWGDIRDGQVIGKDQAEKILEAIFNQDYQTVTDFMTNTKAGSNLQEFFPDGFLQGVKNRTVSSIQRKVRREYRGDNNEVISNLINSMVSDGQISETDADLLAADMVDQIRKHSGEFGKVNNELITNIQDTLRVASSFGMMDLVIFSQATELVFHFVGTEKKTVKEILKVSKDLAKGMSTNITRSYADAAGFDLKRNKNQSTLQEVGYFDDSDILKQYSGNQPANELLRQLQSKFYKLNLLEPFTDTVRQSRMVMGLDVINNMIMRFQNVDLNNMSMNEAREFERLSFYGADIVGLVKAYNELGNIKPDSLNDEQNQETVEFVLNQWDIMLPKFIDEMAVRTKPGGAPSAFEDARYGLPLFTQYLQFTANWSSTILPRLWTNYFKDASAPLAFNTFKYMALAVLVAGASQWLKDYLRYGSISPYLEEDYGVFVRAMQYSALTGWYGEALERFDVVEVYDFEKMDKGFFQGLFTDHVISSPAVGWLGKIEKDIKEGDIEGLVNTTVPLADLF